MEFFIIFLMIQLIFFSTFQLTMNLDVPAAKKAKARFWYMLGYTIFIWCPPLIVLIIHFVMVH